MGDCMNIINGIRSYIIDSESKITIINNKVNITNYIDIGHFDNNKIIIKLEGKDVHIKGDGLVVSRLLDSEILITGVIKNIEFR